VALATLLVAGRRFYDDLDRLRSVPPLLAIAIALLWLASRSFAADVMRVGLAALGHRIGRFEAFVLQMVQSYGNVLVPRAGIGVIGVYLKTRRATPFADLGAVQVLLMTVLQLLTIGVVGLLCQAALALPGGAGADGVMAALFAGVAAGCAAPLLIPVPAGRTGGGKVAAFLARLAGAWDKLGRSRALVARVILTHAVMLLVRAVRIRLCFTAIGEPVPFVGALAASLLADLVFVFSITPAGLGFREAAVVYAARVMGTTGDIALAAAVLDRLVSTACNVVVGQVGVWLLIRPVVTGPAARDAAGAADVTTTAAPPTAR
jgi:uncharacterized membrane protein YbhN (UPF0104 family)